MRYQLSAEHRRAVARFASYLLARLQRLNGDSPDCCNAQREQIKAELRLLGRMLWADNALRSL